MSNEFKITGIRRPTLPEAQAQARSLFLNALLSNPHGDGIRRTESLALRSLLAAMYEFVDIDGDGVNIPTVEAYWQTSGPGWDLSSFWLGPECRLTLVGQDGVLTCPDLGDAKGIDDIVDAYIALHGPAMVASVNERGLWMASEYTDVTYSIRHKEILDDAKPPIVELLTKLAAGRDVVVVGVVTDDACKSPSDDSKSDVADSGEPSDN